MGKCFSHCVSNSAYNNNIRNPSHIAGDYSTDRSTEPHHEAAAGQLFDIPVNSEKLLHSEREKMPVNQKRQLHPTASAYPPSNSAKKSKVSNKQVWAVQTGSSIQRSASFEDAVFSLFSQYASLPITSDSVDHVWSRSTYTMSVEGVVAFLEHLEFSPDDFCVLLFAWYCQAAAQCQFTWLEFLRGCESLQASTVPLLRERLQSARLAITQDENRFTVIYKWAFTYCLDEHQRCLDKELALAMWKVVFTVNPVGSTTEPMVQAWLEFIRENQAIKVISQDTWDMFLKFLQVVGRDLSLYNESDAWPTLMDEFMECQLQTGSAAFLNNNNTTRSAAHCID